MQEIARVVVDPAGMTPVLQGCALRGPGTIRCARSSESPRALAAKAQRALTVAAGQPATLSCDLLPSSKAPRTLPVYWCLTQVEDGGHTVTISVDTHLELEAGASLAGADYAVSVN